MFIQIDVGTSNAEDLKLDEGIVITQGSTKIVCKDGVVDKENLDPLDIGESALTTPCNDAIFHAMPCKPFNFKH